MSQSPFSLPPLVQKGLLFPIFFLNGWLLVLLLNYLEPMFSIFMVSVVLAIVLEFPVQFLQQRGKERRWSLLLVLALGLVMILVLGGAIKNSCWGYTSAVRIGIAPLLQTKQFSL